MCKQRVDSWDFPWYTNRVGVLHNHYMFYLTTFEKELCRWRDFTHILRLYTSQGTQHHSDNNARIVALAEVIGAAFSRASRDIS